MKLCVHGAWETDAKASAHVVLGVRTNLSNPLAMGLLTSVLPVIYTPHVIYIYIRGELSKTSSRSTAILVSSVGRAWDS